MISPYFLFYTTTKAQRGTMNDYGFTLKTKQPHDHIEDALTSGQGRARALVKKLSDQAILELADVLQEFTPAAAEREEVRQAKRIKLREVICQLKYEFGDAEEALNQMFELGYLRKPRGRRKKNR